MPKKPAPSVTASETRIRLRVICQQALPAPRYGAEFGLQDNSTTADWAIHAGQTQANGDVHFECECRIRPHHRTGSPRFLGPFVHGEVSKRFLYLSWRPVGWRPGQPDPPCPAWLRRIKVHLSLISWQQIEESSKAGCVLEAVVAGTGPDGGPSCASVPLVGDGWVMRSA